MVKGYQGSKHVLSSSTGQVNFLTEFGQVTLKAYLSNGQGWVLASHPLTKSLVRRTESGFGQSKYERYACPNGKLEFKFFFESWIQALNSS